MAPDSKPFSEACERNKAPILAVLEKVFTRTGVILEIGSGTGQHAVYFARHLPHLVWQPADVAAHLPGINAWLDGAQLANLRAPLELDVAADPWPIESADGIFSANTAHIMAWPEVENMFAGVSRLLSRGGSFCLYGPFNYGGRYTSDSNAQFDRYLKTRDPVMGIRDVDDLVRLGERTGLALIDDVAMPANNRVLVWERSRD